MLNLPKSTFMNNISTYLHAFVYVELNLFCGNFLDLEKDSNEKLPVISVMILKIKIDFWPWIIFVCFFLYKIFVIENHLSFPIDFKHSFWKSLHENEIRRICQKWIHESVWNIKELLKISSFHTDFRSNCNESIDFQRIPNFPN